MKNSTKRNALIAVVGCLILSFIFSGCDFGLGKREYHDDIHIELETRQGELIIREWVYLLGSGSEVYYKEGKKEILLARLVGGDDGYCPFEDGQYSVTVDDDEVTIEWYAEPRWEKVTLQLPSD